MAEESSPRKHSESSASKLLRNAPVDLLGGILVNSIVSTNKSTPEPNTNNLQLASKKNSARDKPALSVPITTLNFKNFVSKCGPVFAVQEAVEAVIAWENPSKTIAFACMWAWLALNPVYFILLPNIVLISILLSTHTQRYPNGTGDDLGTDPISGHHILDDPIEGSPDYVSNLTNIQNLMGDVCYGVDFVKEKVLIYLDWSQPKITLNILHITVLSTIGSTLIVPLIPWRFLLLLGGETVFILNHPYVQVWLAQLKSASTSSV
ncbi:hypothetical protein MJO28_002243 [Puccinia striiformis f. sp. tritici]|uniref:Uncharacterized protein n=1 Tax=Puccinia striiformis f. sp. tritici TaxID=168172 RepID=A0ACC0EVH1_9BASI|nr:hypothetical protein Pst134EA_002535 [Puccinia striiformis f. sp. tritici]KAH9471904.1 hypothetical protein Pst134EA_002535 [Puccinia striiformis f. sp. tritici]KAI7961754.1 hypothetical protein MJO28_002243 [Puccinia striiformis f. sp. tritici]KAI7966577.1 hypothetical protein MJO29_002325 [Puccinia striiformis f. sp. tritici]